MGIEALVPAPRCQQSRARPRGRRDHALTSAIPGPRSGVHFNGRIFDTSRWPSPNARALQSLASLWSKKKKDMANLILEKSCLIVHSILSFSQLICTISDVGIIVPSHDGATMRYSLTRD
jgi:hypothetical protein